MKYDRSFNMLSSLAQTQWNWHEKALSRRIGITASSEAVSVREELTSFICAYENVDKRGVGNKKSGSFVSPSSHLILADIDVRYCLHGKKKPFAPAKLDREGSSKDHVPRWFQVGDDTIDIGIQLAMVREIMGTHRRLDDAK